MSNRKYRYPISDLSLETKMKPIKKSSPPTNDKTRALITIIFVISDKFGQIIGREEDSKEINPYKNSTHELNIGDINELLDEAEKSILRKLRAKYTPGCKIDTKERSYRLVTE